MRFTWPIQPPPKSTKGQQFGYVRSEGARPHEGLDMGTGGDAVLAAGDGYVIESRLTSDSRGRIVRIDHGDDGSSWETRYYHLASASVEKDEEVKAGQQIAVAGQTGLPNPWPHLHFEVHRDGKLIDPMTVLPAKSSPVLGTVFALAALAFLVG